MIPLLLFGMKLLHCHTRSPAFLFLLPFSAFGIRTTNSKDKLDMGR